MRLNLKAILAILPAAVFMSTAANAGQETWRQTCAGPEHVCSAPSDAAVKPATVAKSKVKTSIAKAKAPEKEPVAQATKPKITSKAVAKAQPDDEPVKASKPAKIAKAKKPKAEKPDAVAEGDEDAKPKAKASKPVKAASAKKAKVAKPAAVAEDDEDDQPKSKGKAKTASKASGGGSEFQSGVASWYGGNFHGRKTANGETYDMWDMTAAHKTLPFGTRVRVINTRSGDYVDVRINDRGPFVGGRIIDLSAAAAGELGMTSTGVAPVKVSILGKG